ncbi:MAG TPA: hypothetical protein VF043_37065 [Ktedonobacteraceae bacterium]
MTNVPTTMGYLRQYLWAGTCVNLTACFASDEAAGPFYHCQSFSRERSVRQATIRYFNCLEAGRA